MNITSLLISNENVKVEVISLFNLLKQRYENAPKML